MSITYAEKETHVLSGLSDDEALPLDASVSEAEGADLMRRIGLAEGELGTPVAAFNSSI
jgi:hypothetical protein